MNWQNIIWREWQHCDDNDYAERLYKAIYRGPISWLYRLNLKRQPRPYAAEVEAALRQACKSLRGAKHVWERRLDRLDRAKEKPIAMPKLAAGLQDHHWLERFVARHVLLSRGGQAVKLLRPLLDDGPPELRETVLWLLRSIEADTTKRLAQEVDNLVCPTCLVHCYLHETPLPYYDRAKYYGCRACHQSRTFQTWPHGLIVVLDTTMKIERVEQDGLLRVNWFQRLDPFDFDRIEIIQAGDEEIERFAIRVGNDTDPFREPRYEVMDCYVGPACRLSANSQRILDNIFRSVLPIDDRPATLV